MNKHCLYAALLCVAVGTAAAQGQEKAQGEGLMDVVEIYAGYGSAAAGIVEGRVIAPRAASEVSADDSRWKNFRRNARLFHNDERKHQPVDVAVGFHQWQVQTDHEGYFRIELDSATPLAAGWHQVQAYSGGTRRLGELLIVPPANTLGLISDLDDTILVTEVNSKRRMLGNTFFKNHQQRKAVPAVADLYRRVLATNPQRDMVPLFYLSASPRQLHTAITSFLEHNDFPRGVLITKRVTNDRTSDPLLDQFSYKTRKIEEIFTRVPHVRFILVGDDGERDPEIYAWVKERYPERVAAIWIRQVNPDPNRARLPGQRDLVEVLRDPAIASTVNLIASVSR